MGCNGMEWNLWYFFSIIFLPHLTHDTLNLRFREKERGREGEREGRREKEERREKIQLSNPLPPNWAINFNHQLYFSTTSLFTFSSFSLSFLSSFSPLSHYPFLSPFLFVLKWNCSSFQFLGKSQIREKGIKSWTKRLSESNEYLISFPPLSPSKKVRVEEQERREKRNKGGSKRERERKRKKERTEKSKVHSKLIFQFWKINFIFISYHFFPLSPLSPSSFSLSLSLSLSLYTCSLPSSTYFFLRKRIRN